MSVVTENELLALAGRAREVRVKLRASARTPVVRDLLVRLRSQYRTHDRLGTQPFQPGDSARLLILRDLLNRNQFNVRTYHALAEVVVRVVLDCSRSLLGHPQTGPFAVKLAFVLALAGVWRKQPAGLAFLDGARRYPPTPTVSRFQQIGGLVRALAGVRPVATPAAAVPRLLEQALGRPRANTNLFLVVHAGYPLASLEAFARVLQARGRQATVFPVVATEEFDPDLAALTDPEAGRRLRVPAGHADRLAVHLDRAAALGRHLGVVVEPLVVADHAADLETLLPLLAGG